MEIGFCFDGGALGERSLCSLGHPIPWCCIQVVDFKYFSVGVMFLCEGYTYIIVNLPLPLLVCMKFTDSSVREMSFLGSITMVSRIESLSIIDISSYLDWESSISASSMASIKVLMREPLLTIFLLSLVAA